MSRNLVPFQPIVAHTASKYKPRVQVSDDYAAVLGLVQPTDTERTAYMSDPLNQRDKFRLQRWKWWVSADKLAATLAEHDLHDLRRLTQIAHNLEDEVGTDAWARAAIYKHLAPPRATYTDDSNRGFFGPVKTHELFSERDLIEATPHIEDKVAELKAEAKRIEAWIMTQPLRRNWTRDRAPVLKPEVQGLAEDLARAGADPIELTRGVPLSILFRARLYNGGRWDADSLRRFVEHEVSERRKTLLANRRRRTANREAKAAQALSQPVSERMTELAAIRSKPRPATPAQIEFAARLWGQAGRTLEHFDRVFGGRWFSKSAASHLIDAQLKAKYGWVPPMLGYPAGWRGSISNGSRCLRSNRETP